MSVRRRALQLLLVLMATAGAAGVAGIGASAAALAQETPQRNAAPDAFYLSLLRDGKAEMLRGDVAAAKKSFRLACFGFLEQPVILAEGLVRLGLAEAALADREAFVVTFSRLVEVEERFSAYAPAALSADERRSFEGWALKWIAPEALGAIPGFATMVARKNALDLAKLAPGERLRELEKRSAAEPGELRWKLLLAEEDVANDRMAKALARLDGAPDAAGEGSVGCLRGQALARLKRCEEAIAPLAACATATSDALLAEALLGCLSSLKRPDEAREFAARLEPPASVAPAIRKAVAHIAPPAAVPAGPNLAPQRDPKAEKSPAREPASVAAEPKPVAAPKASAPRPTQELTPDEVRAVDTAREMLQRVDNREELQRGLVLVRPVADRLPGHADLQLLVGEIAYRARQWTTGAEYFRRSTPDREGPIDPTQRFYLAVCLYEAGDFAGAAQVASTGLEKLQRPPFVDSYLRKIRSRSP